MKETLLAQIPTAVVTALFMAGAAWGAVKQALNGTKKDVKETMNTVRGMDTRLRTVETDVAFLRGRESKS